MAATPSWPPPPALLGYRRCEAVFRSAREEAAPSACFVADRRALSRHCGSARHAAGMGTDRELRSYSPRWMRSTAKLAENVRRRDEFPRRRCWGWTAAGTGPKVGLVKLSLPDMRQKRVVLQAYAAVMTDEPGVHGEAGGTSSDRGHRGVCSDPRPAWTRSSASTPVASCYPEKGDENWEDYCDAVWPLTTRR